MKYSNYIGVFASLAIIAVCFAPWVFIPSLNLTLNGIHGRVNEELDFGKQVISHSFFAILMIVLFITPRIWAKRTNVFLGAMQMGWSIKNFLILTGCRLGECPEKRWGIFTLLILSVVILLMALFPKVDLKEDVDQL